MKKTNVSFPVRLSHKFLNLFAIAKNFSNAHLRNAQLLLFSNKLNTLEKLYHPEQKCTYKTEVKYKSFSFTFIKTLN